MQITPRFGALLFDQPSLTTHLGTEKTQQIMDTFAPFNDEDMFASPAASVGPLDASISASKDGIEVRFPGRQERPIVSQKDADPVRLVARVLSRFLTLKEQMTTEHEARQLRAAIRSNR
jgi:hypothetical protein